MAKSITKTNRPRLTLDTPPALRRRIKVAAAAQDLSVSAYVTQLLDRAVPAGRTLKKKADGIITAETLRRFAAFPGRADGALPGGLSRFDPREQDGAREPAVSADEVVVEQSSCAF